MYVLENLSDPRDNPAVVLYNYWASILEGWHGPPQYLAGEKTWALDHTIPFGRSRAFGIGVVDSRDDPDPHTNKPTLGLGYVHYAGHQLYPLLRIRADGEFQIRAAMHGWDQRDKFAANTFLEWRYFNSQYHWMYGLERVDRYTHPDWQQPIHYVNERTLGLFNVFQKHRPVWTKLQRLDNEWTIQFSQIGQGFPNHRGLVPDVDGFAKMDKLRERRYRSWERTSLINRGLLTPKARSILSEQQREEALEKASLALSAHLQVGVAHPSASPRKKKEVS